MGRFFAFLKNKTNRPLILVAVFFLASLLVFLYSFGFLNFLTAGSNEETKKEELSPTPSPSPTEEPTPTEEIDTTPTRRVATSTPKPTATKTPAPTNTPAPSATATPTPITPIPSDSQASPSAQTQ